MELDSPRHEVLWSTYFKGFYLLKWKREYLSGWKGESKRENWEIHRRGERYVERKK